MCTGQGRNYITGVKKKRTIRVLEGSTDHMVLRANLFRLLILWEGGGGRKRRGIIIQQRVIKPLTSQILLKIFVSLTGCPPARVGTGSSH